MSTDQEDFRSEVRDWLRENVPKYARPHSMEEAASFDVEWQRKQFEGGWSGLSWPKEYGGKGLSLLEQLTWHEEYARAGGPYLGINYVGLNHAGPTLITLGTESQKRKHLGGILRGDDVWCQGFSEPNAGSDLASLQTRAVIEGGELIVSGQKIWTSYGQFAKYQELLVRTSKDGPKHNGISWVICDMRTPGIDVRPIRTMTGEPEFCEVFYDDVRIPLANVVGEIDSGWRVAMTTLGFERGTGFIPFQIRLSRTIDEMIAYFRALPRASRLESFGERLAQMRAEVAAMRAMTYAVVARADQNGAPGAESTIIALYYGELAQRVHVAALDLLGDEGTARDSHRWVFEHLDSFKETIGGGTSEIRRNIVAERVLGLPR